MSRLNEKDIIRLFSSKLQIRKRIKNEYDDVAHLPLGQIISTCVSPDTVIVLKSDMLVQTTDVPPGMRPWQIARKSIVACVSDMSAKGIEPPYLCLISLGIPSNYPKAMIVDLVRGFKTATKEFGVKIVGGDTNRSNELVISCNLAGFSTGHCPIPKRNGAKPGHLVISSGVFGFSSSGLKILLEKASARGRFRYTAIKSVLNPQPRQKFGTCMVKFLSSSIDSSDGLAASVYELANQSHVDIILDNIPTAKGLQRFAKENGLVVDDLIYYGGEEYEIIATVSKTNLEEVRRLAKKLKLKVYVIGRVEKGKGRVSVLNSSGMQLRLREGGYTHEFATTRS
jgi:thiamine-monophosphate kinase